MENENREEGDERALAERYYSDGRRAYDIFHLELLTRVKRVTKDLSYKRLGLFRGPCFESLRNYLDEELHYSAISDIFVNNGEISDGARARGILDEKRYEKFGEQMELLIELIELSLDYGDIEHAIIEPANDK